MIYTLIYILQPNSSLLSPTLTKEEADCKRSTHKSRNPNPNTNAHTELPLVVHVLGANLTLCLRDELHLGVHERKIIRTISLIVTVGRARLFYFDAVAQGAACAALDSHDVEVVIVAG